MYLPVIKFMLCRSEDMSELATVEGSAPDRTNLGRTLKIVGTMITDALEKASLDRNTKVQRSPAQKLIRHSSTAIPNGYGLLGDANPVV